MENMVRSMLSAIDDQDLTAFESYLAEDASFTFANGPVVEGRSNILATVKAVLQTLQSISHTVQRFWSVNNVIICEGRVRYVDGLGQTLDAPYVDVLTLDMGGLIADYRVYVDASQLNKPQQI